MNWRCGSSNKAPILQVGSPEFKPQFHPKKILRKKENTRGWEVGRGWREGERMVNGLRVQLHRRTILIFYSTVR
jgi:hypothetical protein